MHPRTGHTTRKDKTLRKRVPLIVGVLLCAATAISLFTGAAAPVPGVRFELPGHWVYDALVHAAFHIEGGSGNIDAQAPVPGDPGDQVVQGGTSGYVVGNSRITQFGQSSLSVEGTSTPPSTEIPVGIEATGGPYLVYRDAGQVVRLGDSAVVIPAGGPVGVPVVSTDGTMWLYRTHSGQLCELTKDATTIGGCPGTVSGAHQGALTLVADHPEFVDTTADTVRPVSASGLGNAIPLGVHPSPDSVPAPNDVAGKVAILDQTKHQLYLVDPAQPATAPVTVNLPPANAYDGPVSSGGAVAVVDRADNTLLTYGKDGKQIASTAIPNQAGPPRLSRGDDGQVYVDDYEGNDVFVVGPNGTVVNVPVAPSTTTPSPDQKPATPTAPPPAGPGTGPPAHNEPPAGPPRLDAPPASPVKPQHSTAPPPPPPAIPATPPGAPSSVSATAGTSSATVHWGAAPDNRSPVTQYRISWSGGSTTVSGGDREATVSGLTDGTQYVFSVAAINAIGTGPSVTANPVTPVDVAGAPTGLTATHDKSQGGVGYKVSWNPPNMHGGQFQHYLLTATGQPDQTVTVPGALVIYLSTPSGTITFTVRAITTGADGRTLTGAAASISVTPPSPKIQISRGSDTSSSDCKAPSCAWIDVAMTGFAPDTSYSVMPYSGNGHNFSEPCKASTDSSGDTTCDDIRYDVSGETVYVTVQTADGTITSNSITWT